MGRGNEEMIKKSPGSIFYFEQGVFFGAIIKVNTI